MIDLILKKIVKQKNSFNKNLFINIGLSLISVIITLLAVESLLARFNLVQPIERNWYGKGFLNADPNLIYTLYPEDLPNQFDAEYKIIAVGDSFTFGYDRKQQQTYPDYLEQELQNLGIDAQVINAGVPGYGLDQEYLFLRDTLIPNLKPDLVIWNFNLNDLGDSNDACLFKESYPNHYRQYKGSHNTIYIKKYFLDILPRLLEKSRIIALLYQSIPERRTIGCSQGRYTKYEDFYKKAVYFLSNIKNQLAEYNSSLITTLVINQKTLLTPKSEPSFDKSAKKIFASATKKVGVPYYDLNSIVKRSQVLGVSIFLDEDPFYPHPNPTGYQLMAQAVTQIVSKHYYYSPN